MPPTSCLLRCRLSCLGPVFAGTLATLALAGCSGSATQPAASSAGAPVLPAPLYHSFGDSITYGVDLPDRSTQAYPALVAAKESLPLTNYANSGDMSCDVPARQIFGNNDSPSAAQPMVYSLLIGTNDIAFRGTGPYEVLFNLCQQASISWLALPSQFKVAATLGGVTGPSHLETTNNWNAVTTDAAGAALSFTFQHTGVGAVYVWYRITDGNPGTFTYAIDGQPLGSLALSIPPGMGTVNGTLSSLALLRIPAVAMGQHTLVLTQTSTGASGMGIVALGLPPGVTFSGHPRVLVGTIPPQNQDGISQCAPSTVPCQIYTADVTANVQLIAGDGLDVELFDTGKYMVPYTDDFYDNYHPNVQGHMEIAHAVEDIY